MMQLIGLLKMAIQLYQNGLKIPNTNSNIQIDAINWASKNGHIAVLEWFKNSEYEFKYTDDAIDWAS